MPLYPPASGGGDALTSDPLSQFAATTSAELAGVVSNETGSGALVFGTSPAIATPTGIVKGDVGLGNVDNTSDANKPVSTAQATADGLRVLKAGDTMTGALVNTLATGNSLVIDTDTLVVDATNNRVGIGTTSPTTLLNVSRNDATAVDAAIPQMLLENPNTTATAYAVARVRTGTGYVGGYPELWMQAHGGTGGILTIRGVSNHAMAFKTNDTERMRIDATGLVGIGVTPTASNGYLQLPASTTLATGGIAWGTDTNLYRSAADTLKTDDALIVGGAVTITSGSVTGITDITVADGGTGRSTSTTAYGLLAAGTTATGAHQTLAAGATTEILVGGGASALPVWTTAQGSGAPVRATSPTLTTPKIAQINDTNGNAVLGLTSSASAVNSLAISNGPTGVFPSITATGPDTNISIPLIPKGAGRVTQNGISIPTISSTDTLTNKDLSSATNTFPNGMSVGFASTMSSAVASGTGVIPFDDTIPQITEGTEFMTLAYTPKSTTNTLLIEVTGMFSNTALNDMSMALFQDATANALMAIDQTITSGYVNLLTFKHTMTAGTTSSTTFRVRAGGSAASTTTFNGVGGPTRRFGAIPKSSIVITEYKA